jgi:hypothetical protein
MGVEWTLACVGCRHFAWLGSMKPYKWNGFQVGDGVVAELLALHSGPDCSLIVSSDARAWTPAWAHDDATAGWLEDLRSRWFWDSIVSDVEPLGMICAVCRAPLQLPATPEGEALRRAGYRSHAGGAVPLVVGRYLWFCGPNCLDRHRSVPGRTWRACSDLAATTRLEIGCLHCGVQHSLGDIAGDPERALAFAEWLTEHIYDPADGSGVEEETACRLLVRIHVP